MLVTAPYAARSVTVADPNRKPAARRGFHHAIPAPMLRVRDLDAALDFYCNKLGLTEVRRRVDDKAKFTLVFLAASADDELVAEVQPAAKRRWSS